MARMTRHEAELIWARVEAEDRLIKEQVRRTQERVWRYLAGL